MTRPGSKLMSAPSESAATAVSVGVPVRRTRWVSFWVGVAAVFLSLLAAVALAGLLLLLPVNGTWVVIAFGALWFGLFFLSLPWQRGYARSFDLRRPGARLQGGRLTIPLGDDAEMSFDLNEPHELTYGWLEIVMSGGAGPTTNTRGLVTYAVLSQGGRGLFLQAEDSVSEAQSAGWPNRTNSFTPDLGVRLWASDLVTLVEAVRTHARPAPPQPQTDMPPTDTTDTREEPVREWPENPLPARNRHEVSLFLEWMKVELMSRAPAEGGEVCVGRVRGADPEAKPDTYRMVFSLLEADPDDEHDFGTGVSKLFDPADLMLLLSRMEREGQFGTGGNDAPGDAARTLTYRTTREVEALRRAYAQGAALVEQLMRFGQAEGHLDEESIKGSTKRTWYRGARGRFDVGTLEAKGRAFRESLRLLQLPAVEQAGADKQAKLVRELRERCPAYLAELRQAGFEDEHVLHPLFSHAHHLARFAARAILGNKPEEARTAFATLSVVEPSELLFPTREFAEAVYELELEPETAAPFVPANERHAFSSHHQSLLDPDYNPWSY